MRRVLWACAFIVLNAAAAFAQGNCVVVNGVSQCASPWRIYDSTVRSASFPILDLSQTWNGPTVTFTGLKVNVTDTNSATASLLLDLQVGGTSKFSVTKAGGATVAGPFLFPDGTVAAPSIAFSSQTGLGFYRAAASILDLAIPVYSVTVPMVRYSGSVGQILGAGIGIGFVASGGAGGTITSYLRSPGAAQLLVSSTQSETSGYGLSSGTDGTMALRGRAFTAGTGNLDVGAKITAYNNISTAGWGVEVVQAQATTGTVSNGGTASIATYTPGAADGIFRVSCDVSITVSTTHSFSCDVTYTDVTNAARTLVLPMFSTAGAQLTTNLMTNTVGTGAFSSSVMQIRVKASTAIVVRTSSGGTFTTVTYTASGTITQVG